MTAYHATFIPIFMLGVSIATIASFFAGRVSGCLWPGVLMVMGVVSFWVALFLGSDLGYRAWQAIPDPPNEAFSDASVLGALVLGWLPGGMFCMTIFGLVRGMKWFLHWANPDVFPSGSDSISEPVSTPVETGNPYQGPGIG